MSLKVSIETVRSPIKELLLSVSKDGAELVGTSSEDQTEVASWVEKVGREEVGTEASIPELETQLLQKTYLVSNYLTAADVALYGALHPIISKQQPAQYFSTPSVTRYFGHLQAQPVVKEAAKAAVEASTSAPAKEKPAKEKQPKKEKKKDNSAADQKKAAAAEADAGEPAPSMIDLRIGRIVDIKKHPDADSLYVEQIDIGEETGPRTVVSGLVNYIPIEQMRDKYLVAVCNLKPANMRGVKSFAMVLCATSPNGKEGGIELVQPPANAKPGDRVYFEGADYENATPLSQLNPKKKIFETIQPGFTTLDTREAAWINPATKSVHRIRTKDGLYRRAPPFFFQTPNTCFLMLPRSRIFAQAVRTFSSSARANAHVSHIGREPIKFPETVTLSPSPTSISVTGPLGTTSVPLRPYMKIDFPQNDTMTIVVEDPEIKEQRAMWGTTRTLIYNAIVGMTEGFTVPLYLVGVGYRVMLEDDPRGKVDGCNGQRLNMKLGYSHFVYVPIPAHIKAEVPSPTKIVLSCTDKHQLGLFAAKVRSYRKPEPYKGKGIFVGTEQIRIKTVKKK
ncbi:hypothetical protein ONZ45_g4449 [Pleurotus djamor]|nr:hypothetical protein ONZ45_g4449 [Pleurotus djamor]